MSKPQVKKLLTGMSKEEVITIVMGLYDARKEAQEYLDYFAHPNKKGELEKFKKVARIEFGDFGKHNPTCRFSVCRKALSDFKKLSPSAETLAEAMVFYVERVYEFSFNAGDLWEQYYNSAISNFRSTLKFLIKKQPDGVNDAAHRTDNGMELAVRIWLPRRDWRNLLRTSSTTILRQGG